jgi:hypothetical protein
MCQCWKKTRKRERDEEERQEEMGPATVNEQQQMTGMAPEGGVDRIKSKLCLVRNQPITQRSSFD